MFFYVSVNKLEIKKKILLKNKSFLLFFLIWTTVCKVQITVNFSFTALLCKEQQNYEDLKASGHLSKHTGFGLGLRTLF